MSFTSLEGKSEVRSTYGGFFVGISVYAFYTQSAESFLTIGFGWLLAAFVRAITLMSGSFSLRNLGGVVFETLVGVLCLWSLV